MEAKRILNYLRDIAANNNRPWFLEHKAEYDACRKSFNDGIAKAINRLAEYDPEIKPVADALAPLNVLNATTVAELKTQLAAAKEQIEAARKALVK